MSTRKIDVEVSLSKPKSTQNIENLQKKLGEFLKKLPKKKFETTIRITPHLNLDPELAEVLDTITFDENTLLDNSDYKYHFYYPFERSCESETLENSEGEDETSASNHWILPNREFQGLYESLVYDIGIKESILKFAETAIIFGKYNVDKHLISCNRIILLHGPPGTGKTSLCKAIAQKLSIRLNSIYKFTHFVEINSHSLFSKWFSESGKLVAKLFAKIREMILQPNSLVCVLIDEVESIAYHRNELSGEPKDALRVVNAVLTQLDQLKQYSNVMIFTTSNLMNTIDIAFVDRVDLKKFIGFPTVKAIYSIYLSSIQALTCIGLISKTNLLTFDELKLENNSQNKEECKDSFQLNQIAEASQGFSGRTLRKIPFLAYTYIGYDVMNVVELKTFLKSMLQAVHDRTEDTKNGN